LAKSSPEQKQIKILLSELRNAENEWRDYRTRQWESVKYYTSIVTFLLSISSGFIILSVVNRTNLDGFLIPLGIVHISLNVLIILISYFASLNLYRETRHLFSNVLVVHNIRKKLKLYSQDLYPDTIYDEKEFDKFKNKKDPDKAWIDHRSGLLYRRIENNEDHSINNYSVKESVKVLFSILFRKNIKPTFLGIMLSLFSVFMIIGFLLAIITLFLILKIKFM